MHLPASCFMPFMYGLGLGWVLFMWQSCPACVASHRVPPWRPFSPSSGAQGLGWVGAHTIWLRPSPHGEVWHCSEREGTELWRVMGPVPPSSVIAAHGGGAGLWPCEACRSSGMWPHGVGRLWVELGPLPTAGPTPHTPC